MSFVSYSFAALLLAVVLVRVLLGPREVEPAYLVVLLAASLLFYAWHVPAHFAILLASVYLAVYVDKYWSLGGPPGTSALTAWVLALMFGGQIFCDFAGYSNIARGVALLLGFGLPINFDAPYLASSFKNFW